MLSFPIIIGTIVPSPEGGWNVIDSLKSIFTKMFEIMLIPIEHDVVSFTLMDVFIAGGILLLTGNVIALLFVWTQKRR